MSVIVVPVRHEVDCIVQAGVRYCENTPPDNKTFGIGVVIITFWILGILWLVFEKENYWGALLLFLLPFILMIIL